MTITRPRFRSPAAPASVAVALTLLLAWPGPSPQAAGERRDPATVTLAADLRAAPESSAPAIATLASGDAVQVLEMRGEYARVATDAGEGWMPASKLRLGAAEGGGSGGGGGGVSWLRGLTGMLGGSADRGSGADVPIGVRGLTREDVASANPDPEAVDRLGAFRAGGGEALAHARDVGLSPRDVPYRDAPPPSPSRAEKSGQR